MFVRRKDRRYSKLRASLGYTEPVRPHGKSPFVPSGPAESKGALSSQLSPTTRTSCSVIYRPYLRPANCLFKHNKTAVPPFNLRGALFRVRSPFRFPSILPLHRSPTNASFLLSFLLCSISPRFLSHLLSSHDVLPPTHSRFHDITRRTRSRNSTKSPHGEAHRCNYMP